MSTPCRPTLGVGGSVMQDTDRVPVPAPDAAPPDTARPPLPDAGFSLPARLGLLALGLLLAFGALHLLAPSVEAPLAFDYLDRPFRLAPRLPALTGAPAVAPPDAAALPTRDDAEAAAALAVAEAFIDAMRRGDYATAWARLDPAAGDAPPGPAPSAATEAEWTHAQRIWDAATGPAPALTITRVAGYPDSPSRLAALVESPAIEASQAERGRPFPPLALELVRRGGTWYVARPGPLWADGSPLLLRPADRAGLGWLRYPLRVVPFPEDLALMARLAALPPTPASTLLDIVADERALVASENPTYDPIAAAPGARATWSVPPGTTRAPLYSLATETLRGAGWEVVPSPIRLRLYNAAGSGELDTTPVALDANAPVERATLHVVESAAGTGDRAAALAFRQALAEAGARADTHVARLVLPRGARPLPSPGEPSSTIASNQGGLAGATFVYYFERGSNTPNELRGFYTGQLLTNGWGREGSASEPGFKAPDGSGRLYVTGFEDTPLRRLAGFSLAPGRYVLVFATGRT